jgi:hypothetical protein
VIERLSLSEATDATSGAASGALFACRSWRSIGLPASRRNEQIADFFRDDAGSATWSPATTTAFILTGAAAGADTLLETNLTGVFAAGDVRSGSTKRCAIRASRTFWRRDGVRLRGGLSANGLVRDGPNGVLREPCRRRVRGAHPG